MIFDTDVLIWALRGNTKAAKALDRPERIRLSIVNYMELLRGTRNKKEMKLIQAWLSELAVEVLPLTETIGHRASIYMEEYVLKTRLEMADALVAATAVENRLPLYSGNARHFRGIADLELKTFRP